ncbi:uncharacterized protein [Drosophila virilis]|uniref:Uncharacterized protein, isoform D n=1 Tax=Drosophila virilis TaxID=7244 RepID=A0A0Q9VXT1_DROVI|nr:uncharacterized protein LOC6636831 isoform X3 [Drosophila virilis]KRF77603.1 uncharacterized protein Dvir_GJ17121, isoform D [Drosophila virilis]
MNGFNCVNAAHNQLSWPTCLPISRSMLWASCRDDDKTVGWTASQQQVYIGKNRKSPARLPAIMLEQDTTPLKKASITVGTSNFANLSDHHKVIWHNGDVHRSSDSGDSMEILANDVLITIDGEKHWVSGIDLNTTCTDLIIALLHYQDVQQMRSDGHAQPYNKSKKDTSSQVTNHNSPTTNTKDKKHTFKSKDTNPNTYVIVKQLPNCRFEEYLDGSSRLLDVIPTSDTPSKNQCELQLRYLGRTPLQTSPRVYNQKQNQMFSMLSMSTDKDSGMGSPMGSSRSNKYRRRRGKQKTGIAGVTGNTPFRGGAALLKRSKYQVQPFELNPNERLMNIINRQIYLLNQKEQQILKIEYENHQKRELELGKNYMLDVYLNSADNIPNKRLNAHDFDDQRQKVLDSNVDKPQPAQCSSGEVNGLDWPSSKEGQEEQLLCLHAKVRKHQMRCVYHTKQDVLRQIDRLDMDLANQVNDIYRVERQLLIANEQLKAKLGVLESLEHEFGAFADATQEIDQNSPVCSTNLALKCNAQQFIRDLQEKDSVNVNITLIKNNSNKQDCTDTKMLKKQMFFTVDNFESLYNTLPNNTYTAADSCFRDRKEQAHPTARNYSYPEINFSLGLAESDFDIQYLGTLV